MENKIIFVMIGNKNQYHKIKNMMVFNIIKI